MMTVMMSFAASIGSILVAVILNATGTLDNRWAYRAVFVSQYGFAAVAVAFVWFMPESPFWLISKGKDQQALRSLYRLGYCDKNDEKRLARIKFGLYQTQSGFSKVSYLECFYGVDRRRTIVAIAPSM
jgi:MFS transporter, SP family, general alpha glucoside:H+ symporter